MATPGLQLISRIIKTGELKKAEEWGTSLVDMLTTEEQGMWNMIRSYFHSTESLGAIPGPQLLRGKYPNFEMCDDPHMTLEALCHEARRAALIKNTKSFAVQLAKECEVDPVAALNRAQVQTSKLLGYGTRTQDVELHNIYDEILSDYERAQSGLDVSKVRWPWPSLQDITGGLQEDDFIVFYGRPKSMKSWVLCYLIAFCYSMGNNVLIYTKEMTAKNILKRVVACMLKLPYQEFRRGRLTPSEFNDLRDFREALKELKESQSMTVLSGKDAQGGDTIQWLHSKIEKNKPDVVFVDGLYLMSMANMGKNVQDHQRVQSISRDARQMQLATKIPLICTMQANRKAAQHTGAELDEIAHSDAIAQDATGIFRTINEKNSPTIALVAGGNREYNLHGLRIMGQPAVDFTEKEIMTEKEILNAKEGDAKGTEESGGTGGTRKRASKKNGANGLNPYDSTGAINQHIESLG